MTRSSWDERFDRWGQTIGARYRLWMVGTSLLACGLMSVSLAIAPFVMLLPEFSPTGSVLAAREMGRIQAVHGVASQSDAVQTQQQYVVENFCVIFRHREGGSLLDRDVISRMKQMEDMVLNHAGYADLCKHAAGVSPPVCQPPASIVNIAYASKRSLGGDALITVLDREGELAADPATDIFRAMVEGSEWLDQLLANNDGCRRPPHHCAYSRTLFLLAGPLAGFSNLQERKSEQAAIFLSFLEQISRDVLLPLAANASEPLQISFTGDELWRYELNVYIYRDAMMTTGSFALLFSYFVLHTRSLVISTLAVITILLAFPTSYFFYRTVFGCDVNGLTVMAMFVVLGVAADDIFIVVDNWRRSRFAPRDGGLGRRATAAERAGFVLRHAAPAMAITSATTISAFMTATLSMIPTIRLFGFFAAIVVAANYLLVCTFFLASLAMYEDNLRRRDWLCRKRKPLARHSDLSISDEVPFGRRANSGHGGGGGGGGGSSFGGYCGSLSSTRPASLRLSRSPSVTFSPDTPPLPRDGSVSGRDIGAGGGSCAGSATRSVGVFSAEELAELAGAADTVLSGTPAASGATNGGAHGGANGGANGGAHGGANCGAARLGLAVDLSTPSTPGRPPPLSKRQSSLDDLALYNMGAPQRFLDRFFPHTFVPFADRNRRKLLALFAAIMLASAVVGSRFRLEDKASMMLPAKSNIETFRTWTEEFSPSLDGAAVKIHFIWGIVGIDRSHIDTSDPDDHGLVLFDPHLDAWADQEAIVAFCERLARPELAPYTAQPAKAECPMAGFKGYRLQRNLTWPLPTQAAFIDKLREYLATPEGFDYTQRVGLTETGGVIWQDVSVVSSLAESQHGAVLHTHYEAWEAFTAEANAAFNFSSPAFQTADAWKEMATLDSLASTAIVGIVCSLTFATSCMLAVTGEWRLTLFATVTIACIVITLVAAYVLMGRTLGFMESVNLAIVSGLAVDYTLHIAHLYQHSDKATRLLRVQESMSLVGISIFSGATTTLLASSMLFCAYIKMSQAFGATIFLSILFSFIYALGLFVPLLLEFGPLPDKAGKKGAQTGAGPPDAHVESGLGGHGDDGDWVSANGSSSDVGRNGGVGGNGVAAGSPASGVLPNAWAHPVGGFSEHKPMLDSSHVDSSSLPPDPTPRRPGPALTPLLQREGDGGAHAGGGAPSAAHIVYPDLSVD